MSKLIHKSASWRTRDREVERARFDHARKLIHKVRGLRGQCPDLNGIPPLSDPILTASGIERVAYYNPQAWAFFVMLAGG